MGKVLITGINSFTGRYLVDALHAQNFDDIIGTTHQQTPSSDHLISVDLCNREAVYDFIKNHKPEYVVHLAAISFAMHQNISEIYQTNIIGTRNLLEALANLETPPQKIILASSAAIYAPPKNLPIYEDGPITPSNDYGVSKYAMELMAHQWQTKLPIMITRPFNYTGVGQAKHFLVPKIISHFQEKADIIELGNLDIARDFSDVRDIAKIYVALLQSPKTSGIYNLSSGRSIALEDILKTVSNISGHELKVFINPSFQREGEIKNIVGDSQYLFSIIPPIERYQLEDTLAWMFHENS